MLQKDPEARPSANDLYTLRLPEFMVKEEEEEEEEGPPDITKTKYVTYRPHSVFCYSTKTL